MISITEGHLHEHLFQELKHCHKGFDHLDYLRSFASSPSWALLQALSMNKVT